jgi:hypothetical protein
MVASPSAPLDGGVGADFGHGLAELPAQREDGEEQRSGKGAAPGVGRNSDVEGRDRLRVDLGPVLGVAWLVEGQDRSEVGGDRCG